MAGRRPGDRETHGTPQDATQGQPGAVQAGRLMPSQEALDALGELVQRARQASTPSTGSNGGPTRDGSTAGGDESRRTTAPVPVIGGPVPEVGARPMKWPRRSGSGRRRRAIGGAATPRWLVRAVAVLALMAILLGLAVLAVFAGRHPAPLTGSPPASSPRAGGPATSTTNSLPPASAAGTTTTTVTSTTAAPTTSSTSTTSTSAPPGGGPAVPRLTSLNPAAGGAGSVVVVRGTNFYSPKSGVVLARVDGQPAGTDCPSQSSCQVTIPDLGGRPRVVTITVTTDRGTSNALPFHYT
jgi:hypothetical protein